MSEPSSPVASVPKTSPTAAVSPSGSPAHSGGVPGVVAPPPVAVPPALPPAPPSANTPSATTGAVTTAPEVPVLPIFNPNVPVDSMPTDTANYANITTTFNAQVAALVAALGGSPATPTSKTAAAKALTGIIRLLVSVNANWIFDLYLKAYKANYKGAFSDTNALSFQGYLTPNDREAASTIHTVFFALASGQKVFIDPGLVKTTSHVTNLVSWMEIQKRVG